MPREASWVARAPLSPFLTGKSEDLSYPRLAAFAGTSLPPAGMSGLWESGRGPPMQGLVRRMWDGAGMPILGSRALGDVRAQVFAA